MWPSAYLKKLCGTPATSSKNPTISPAAFMLSGSVHRLPGTLKVVIVPSASLTKPPVVVDEM
jgi:hypothetical protein